MLVYVCGVCVCVYVWCVCVCGVYVCVVCDVWCVCMCVCVVCVWYVSVCALGHSFGISCLLVRSISSDTNKPLLYSFMLSFSFPVLGTQQRALFKLCKPLTCDTSLMLRFWWKVLNAFLFKIYLFILCLRVHYYSQTHQKRASDPITDGCEPPCGCWELNSGPLEEQSMLLTTEPSLQPLNAVLYKKKNQQKDSIVAQDNFWLFLVNTFPRLFFFLFIVLCSVPVQGTKPRTSMHTIQML